MSDLSDDENIEKVVKVEDDEPKEQEEQTKKKRTITKEQQQKMIEARRAKNEIKKQEKLKIKEEEKAIRKANRPKKEVPSHVLENLKKGRESLHKGKQTKSLETLKQKTKEAKKKLIDLQSSDSEEDEPPTPKASHKKPISKPKSRPEPVEIQKPKYTIRFV